jgi:hypothetical protein
MNNARNVINSKILEKHKFYFVKNLPRLNNIREKVLKNLIKQSKLSKNKNYLSGNIKKCLNFEKDEIFLNEYISKDIGYKELHQLIFRFNKYISDLSKISDRFCKNPKIFVDIQRIEIPDEDDLKGGKSIKSSSYLKGSTLPKLENSRSTPVNSQAARAVGKYKKN